ncbi:MAG: ABC transporter ATP-binding protein [Candidatus Parvarchaeota archaeon]
MSDKALEESDTVQADKSQSGVILKIDNLHVSFFTRRGEVKAIRGISLELRRGEILGIVGESGCGKSVTSLSIVDLLPSRIGAITDGDIIFESENVTNYYKKEFKIIRRKKGGKIRPSRLGAKKVEKDIQRIRGKISMIFQDPLTSLDPLYKVQTQMLESILYNSIRTIIKRVLEKDDLRHANVNLLNSLSNLSSIDFMEQIKKHYGEEGFYQELLYIVNMNLNETDKKLRIMRSIMQVPDLTERKKNELKLKLSQTKRKVWKPKDRRKAGLANVRDPVIREAILYSLELLEFMDMPSPERVLDCYPHELSGGMKQRVMIALALANNPKILIADEPTTSLDVTTQYQILYLLKSLNKKLGLTIIFITHDLGVMAAIADRIAVMYSGKISEVGPANLFFTNPLHPYTQGLLKSVPVETEKKKILFTIPGQVPDLLNPPTGCPFAERCNNVMEICLKNDPPKVTFKGRDVYCWLYEGGKK